MPTLKKEKQIDASKELNQARGLMDEILDDLGVPKNIRASVERAQSRLSNPNELDSSLSTAIYELDDVSKDINMPEHIRTLIWEIVSELERVKEMVKK